MAKEEKKSMSVLDACKVLNTRFKKATGGKANILTEASAMPECKRFSMGTMSADYALYGGMALGKIISFSGEEGSGKTLASVQAMAKYQQDYPDRTCVYVDAEGTLPGQWEWMVRMTGLDVSPEKFQRLDCCGLSAEQIFGIIITLENTDNIGLIILDSAPALISQDDIKSIEEQDDFEKDNGQRASIAKPLAKFCRIMQLKLARQGNSLIIINHLRIAGKAHNGAIIYEEPCGHALKFYPSIKIRFAKKSFTKGDDLEVKKSDTDVDGICLTFSVTKSRLGPTNRPGAKLVYRYKTGLDTFFDLVSIITEHEIAERVNAQTWALVDPNTKERYKDENGEELVFRGKANMINYLKEHDDFRAMYEQVVNDYINDTGINISLVDKDLFNKLLDEDELMNDPDKKFYGDELNNMSDGSEDEE